MQMTPTMWSQVASAAIVALCSSLVTLMVRTAAKRLENVATKDFVDARLTEHTALVMDRISNEFLKSSAQAIVNADIEARMRRVETAFGVKLRK